LTILLLTGELTGGLLSVRFNWGSYLLVLWAGSGWIWWILC